MKNTSPSTELTSFPCAYCGVFTSHKWMNCIGEELLDQSLPKVITPTNFSVRVNELSLSSPEDHQYYQELYSLLSDGFPRVMGSSSGLMVKKYHFLSNIFFSECHSCKKVTIWLQDKIVFPQTAQVPPPNEDIPEDIKSDYI